VAVYFEWDGAQRCVAVDRFPRPEDNVRAIYYVLEARRQEMRYGGLNTVRAAFRGFLALPPPDDWRAVLGVGPEADLEAVEAAWRNKARTAHPDRKGGSGDLMAELNAARAAARRELSS
jgi:DnaJ-domain-containing protein 1